MAIQFLNDELISLLSTWFLRREVWRDWTPTVTQSGSVAVTVNRAKYMVLAQLALVFAEMTVTGAGTAGTGIVIGGIPSAVQPTGLLVADNSVLGDCLVHDVSAANRVYGFVVANSLTGWKVKSSFTNADIGNSPNFALAAGDLISIRLWYERA